MHHRVCGMDVCTRAGEFGIAAGALFMEMNAVPAGLQSLGFDAQQNAFGRCGDGHSSMCGPVRAFEVAGGGQSRKKHRGAESKAGDKDGKDAHVKSCLRSPLPTQPSASSCPLQRSTRLEK